MDASKCQRLHALFNGMKLHKFEKDEIESIGFRDGIYIIFEEGEKAHGGNRIVRVGTTTGDTTTLAGRLQEHYENEGRSVFRNHIALCLLKKNGDPGNLTSLFLEDSIYRNKWKKTANNDELKKYREINEAVTNHIRKHCFFVAFPVKKEFRRFWEEKIISTVFSCTDCEPSKNWIGNVFGGDIAPRRDIIRKSGLWNVQGVNDKHMLTDAELTELEKIVKKHG